MAFKVQPGEQYTIRKQVFKLIGSGFHIYDPSGTVIGYCKKKSFRLKEDIRVYTGEDRSEELFNINARSVIDFGATYDIADPSGTLLGSLRRKGLKSMVRDEWKIYDAQEREVATLTEDSAVAAIARRTIDLAAALIPQKLSVLANDGSEVARFRTHFNPFIYRLSVAILQDHPDIDELTILASACVFAAIDGRQG